MKQRTFIIAAIALMMSAGAAAQTASEMSRLRAGIEADLVENILPFWMDKTVDPAGGFYGAVGREGAGDPAAPKGGILNARILWTFSAAYRIYAVPEYKAMADRAQRYFLENLVDSTYGGVYWTVSPDGQLLDTQKQVYALAFGIYGLSEHFRATGDKASLDAAVSLYRTLEENAHDRVRGGYYEVFSRDWSSRTGKGVDGDSGTAKSMNTNIHVMEALTNLYRVWPDADLRADVSEILKVIQTKVYDPARKHMNLRFKEDWEPFQDEDSYGHDIETSWLMCEAAEVLGDEALIEGTRKTALDMVDASLAEGMDPDGCMRGEGGTGLTEIQWWPQCETVIGCINAWQITGERKYFDAAVSCWDFTKRCFIDSEYGEWYKKINPDRTPKYTATKADVWNCPYHNSRMGFEILSRLAPRTGHTEVMAWSNITGVRIDGELIDFESTLRVGVPGGKIESTGRERQSHIKYHRDGLSQIVEIPMHGAHFNQTVTDVDANTVSLSWKVTADETLPEGAYFCMTFAPDAAISVSGRKAVITSPDQSVSLSFSRSVKMSVLDEKEGKVLYVPLLSKLRKGAEASLSATMKVDGIRHHEPANIAVDLANPGREFAGFGGNFRIQNSEKDPEVIDYCLENMRVAFGRVEFPWGTWDKEGAGNAHVKESAEMARRLKETGMPLIVSCWFPPEWAGNRTTRSDGTSKAFSLKPEETSRIYESLASYLVFLKKNYGAEADYFSFNESDLGIDVVFTAEEHRDFIKGFGKYLAEKGLKTKLLLGDNSDATTFDFILPTLNDPSAWNYVGAISFHSWRGCDDGTLAKWAGASRTMNVPLIIGEGSTDAAAHQYPDIFNETTFALYEINLYTRLCALCQPLSILQWQLTSDYSVLWGDGIYRSEGPLRPTQRFFNLQQLASTPENAFSVPVTCDKNNVNAAAFANIASGACALHIVNNGASCDAVISGFPADATGATVRITNTDQNSEASYYSVSDGRLEVSLPADSFVSIFVN